MPFIRKTHSNAISGESPKLFDQPVVQLLSPLSRKKSPDLLPASHKLGTIPPLGVQRVALRAPLRFARIPAVFREPDFLGRSFESKGRQWWTRGHDSFSFLNSRSVF